MNEKSASPKRTISTDGWPITPELWPNGAPNRTAFEIDDIEFTVKEEGKRKQIERMF